MKGNQDKDSQESRRALFIFNTYSNEGNLKFFQYNRTLLFHTVACSSIDSNFFLYQNRFGKVEKSK